MITILLLIASYFLIKSFWAVGLLVVLYFLSTWFYSSFALYKLTPAQTWDDEHKSNVSRRTKTSLLFFLVLIIAVIGFGTYLFDYIFLILSVLLFIRGYFSEQKYARQKAEIQEQHNY